MPGKAPNLNCVSEGIVTCVKLFFDPVIDRDLNSNRLIAGEVDIGLTLHIAGLRLRRAALRYSRHDLDARYAADAAAFDHCIGIAQRDRQRQVDYPFAYNGERRACFAW